MLVALTGGVRFAGQAWDTQQRRSDLSGDLDAVQNVLRQLITSGSGFEGNEGTLRFVSTLPLALARGGLYDVELRASGDHLLFSWKPHFKGPAQTSAPTEIELIKGVTGFDLSLLHPTRWMAAHREVRDGAADPGQGQRTARRRTRLATAGRCADDCFGYLPEIEKSTSNGIICSRADGRSERRSTVIYGRPVAYLCN